MQAGDTMMVAEPGTSLDSHLWIVISDPQQNSDQIVIVNLTSFRPDKDQACVLDVGDHPFIQKRTCVNYADAKVQPAASLQKLLDSGKIKSHAKCSSELLAKIRAGVAESMMELGIADVLAEQGLVDI